MRRGEVGLGCAQRGQRRPGQEAVGRKLALRILHLIGALADVASGQEDIECGRRHPDHDQGQHHADHDPSPSLPASIAAARVPLRPGALPRPDLHAGGGPSGRSLPPVSSGGLSPEEANRPRHPQGRIATREGPGGPSVPPACWPCADTRHRVRRRDRRRARRMVPIMSFRSRPWYLIEPCGHGLSEGRARTPPPPAARARAA